MSSSQSSKIAHHGSSQRSVAEINLRAKSNVPCVLFLSFSTSFYGALFSNPCSKKSKSPINSVPHFPDQNLSSSNSKSEKPRKPSPPTSERIIQIERYLAERSDFRSLVVPEYESHHWRTNANHLSNLQEMLARYG
jgi:hypothetical protein